MFQEEAGNFKYSDLPYNGFLKKTGSILVGTKPDGTGNFAEFDVNIIKLVFPITFSYLKVLFCEYYIVYFSTYVFSILAIIYSFFSNWDGAILNLIKRFF